MNILLILLGSHIIYLLDNRINVAINFANKFNNTNIDWFLSGGIKNPSKDSITEAERMAQQISLTGDNWNYIYDTEATNTAENFIMVKRYLNENKRYDEIYVITSEFHYERAKKFADIILGFEVKWILGDAKLHDSDYWEKIHMKNVDADINKSFAKFNI